MNEAVGEPRELASRGMQSRAGAPAKPRALPAILVGGLIAGALDLTYAILVYSPRNPIRVPQAIATGLLGPNSFNRGLGSAALGVACHFTIALGAATVFYLASRRLPFLVDHAVIAGMIFGALVYFFMHLVVIPLSAVPKSPFRFMVQLREFVWHWFGVGLPIALSVRRFSR
jgi:uncharacterized membrane protein YagU involved in acid resistance